MSISDQLKESSIVARAEAAAKAHADEIVLRHAEATRAEFAHVRALTDKMLAANEKVISSLDRITTILEKMQERIIENRTAIIELQKKAIAEITVSGNNEIERRQMEQIEQMQDAVKIINARLKQLKQTRYWLAAEAQKKTGTSVSRLYEFLDGKTQVRADNLMTFLHILGLQIVTPDQAKKEPRRRKPSTPSAN